MKSRIILVFLAFFLLWVGLLAKCFFLQVIPNEKLSRLQKKQFEKIVTLKPRRGAIVDRNEKELAVSVASYSLFADPKLVENPRQVAQKITKILKIPFRSVYKNLLKKERRFVWIMRQLDKEMMLKIRKLKFSGIGFIEEPKRVYPNRQLLSHTLGFVGRDGEGLEGLELIRDEVLSGEKTKLHLQRDAHGRPLLISGRMFTNYPDGSNIRLTIDSNVQFFLEKELEFAIEKHDADSAVGVVVDVETSEIVAMANVPLFNPNLPQLYDNSVRRNRTMTDAFEPGSTLKTFVVATAIKNKVVQPNSKFYCEEGLYQIGNRTIKDANHKFGWLTVSDILAKSSNIGMTKVAIEMGDKLLRKGLVEFGFGAETGIQLPGESRGIVNPLPWNKHLMGNVAFGHGVSVTPLQMAMAYAAIANGGTLYRPLLVKSIFNDMNGHSEEFQAKKISKVLSQEEADTMKLILMSVTAEDGSGYNARVPGYPVAGKTGTAQKVDLVEGGYKANSYISSFAGFIPANKPKFVIFVAVDNPRDGYYGSQVAAPLFSKVASFLVRKQGLDPVLISQNDVVNKSVKGSPVTKIDSKRDLIEPLSNVAPDLIGLSLRGVYNRIQGSGIKLSVKGSGLVSKSWPAFGEKLSKDKKIRILLERAE